MCLAGAYLDSKRDGLGRLTIRRWRGFWWAYGDGHYSALSKDALEADLWAWLNRVFVPDKNREPKRLDPKTSTIDNVTRAMMGCGTLVPDDIDPPAHLGKTQAFRDLDTAVTTNGMLDLATGRLSALSPDLFATTALGVAWPDKPPYPSEPAAWLAFLESIWGDDRASIDLLQQWFGYVLTPDTSQQKMLWLLGPPRAGKGTIVRVLRALVGEKGVVSPQLSSLSGSFGLQPWLDKTLAIIPDARLSGRSDQDVILESMLSITGEDHMTVQRKGIASVTCRIPARIMLLSNLAPRLSDSSGALASRILMLRVRKTFVGKEDRDLSTRLMTELPGILGWAIDGWRKLRASGRFDQPESSRDALANFAGYGSPVGSFVEECCVVREDAWIEKADLFSRWDRWCMENGNERGSMGGFARNLEGVIPTLRLHARTKTRRAWFEGVTLDDG
jgi:putative DNA primase/helicase